MSSNRIHRGRLETAQTGNAGTSPTSARRLGYCMGCDQECEDVSAYHVTYNEHAGDAAGTSATVFYCDDCAALAGMNWNGTTAAIAPVSSGSAAGAVA